MDPSLHYCLRIHEHVPPMPSCAQVPFPVPSIPATAATYRQHYHRYRQHYRRYRQHYHCYRRRRRSDRCCRPPGRATGTAPPPLPPLLRRWQLPPTATAALPLPDLTHRRCLCYRRRSTVAVAVCWNVVSFCV